MIGGRLTLDETAELLQVDVSEVVRLSERYGWQEKVEDKSGESSITFSTADVLRDYHAIRSRSASTSTATASGTDNRVIIFPAPEPTAVARPAWIDHLERIASEITVNQRLAAQEQIFAARKVMAMAALMVLLGFAIFSATGIYMYQRWENTEKARMAHQERLAILEEKFNHNPDDSYPKVYSYADVIEE